MSRLALPTEDPLWLKLHDDGVFPDQVKNDGIFSASWVTPAVPSDYYVDLIAYDNAFNPQNPSEKHNWIIYDNIWGFSTQAFISRNPVLYVDDNGAGQKWPRGLQGQFRAFPDFRLGHESEVTDRAEDRYDDESADDRQVLFRFEPGLQGRHAGHGPEMMDQGDGEDGEDAQRAGTEPDEAIHDDQQ